MAGPALEFEFVLRGAGWADLRICKGEQSHAIGDISYLSDALDDLLRLGLVMATDRGHAWAQFFHEPGSTVLFAENNWWEGQSWTTGYRLSVIRWHDFGEEEPSWRRLQDAPRQLVVKLDSQDEVSQAVLLCAERVETENGVEGYSKQWGGRLGFPTRGLAALRAALATPRRPEESWSG